MMKRVFLFLLFLAAIAQTSLYAQCTPVVALSSSPGDSVCAGTPVTFNASVTGGGTATTYEWIVNGSVVSTTGTSYTYTPSDGDSVRFVITTSGPPCTATTVASSPTRNMIVKVPPPIPTITGASALCTGLTLTYTASPAGGTWSSPSANLSINAVTGSVTGGSPGTATISYTYANICGSSVATTIVTVGTLPAITGNPFVYCVGGTTTMSNAATGGTWISSNTAIATVGTLTGVVTGVAPGTVDIGYVITPGFSGCNTYKTVQVLASAPALKGIFATCVGNSTKLSDTAKGGTWSTSSPNATVDTSGNVTGVAAGTAAITYTLNSSCFTSAVVTVVPTPTNGTITGANILCIGLSTSLTETEPGGTWYSLNSAVATVGSHTGIVAGVSAGTVLITYRTPPNALNCYGTGTHMMTIVAPTFTITPSLTNINCYGASDGAITLNITGGNPPFEYYWTGGMTGTSKSGLPAGTYVLTLQETNSRCQGVDSFKLTQPDSMHIVVAIRSDSCGARIGSVNLTVSGGVPPYSYEWTNFPGNSSDSLTGLVRGNYSVTITDNNGCKRELRPVIVDLGCTVGIHDVITPNGDGANDKWIIEGLWLYPDNVVQIFDKWGDLVYEKSNYDGEWVGQGKSGAPLPDGTYFYLLKLNDPSLTNGGIYKGLVMIKR